MSQHPHDPRQVTPGSLEASLIGLTLMSPALGERAVHYVRTGEDEQVLAELAERTDDLISNLLGEPGWSGERRLTPAAEAVIGGRPPLPELVAQHRTLLYRFTPRPTPQHFVRLAQVLAACAWQLNRTVEGVPTWLTVFTNDLSLAARSMSLSPFWDRLGWDARSVVIVAQASGLGAEAAPLALLAMCQQPPTVAVSNGAMPHELPDLPAQLIAHAPQLPAPWLDRLSVPARVQFGTWAGADPQFATAFAEHLARLAVDSAKTVRTAAVRPLALLPDDLRDPLVAAALERAPGSRTGELLTALQQAGAAPVEVSPSAGLPPIELPWFAPLPEQGSAELILQQWRAGLEVLSRSGDDVRLPWAERVAALASQVSQADLLTWLQVANGERDQAPQLHELPGGWAWHTAPALSMLQELRLRVSLGAGGGINRLPPDVDPRAADRLHQLVGLPMPDLRFELTYGDLDPGLAWPYYAEHPELLQAWLEGDTDQQRLALGLLNHFPRVPEAHLPTIRAMALGSAAVTRQLAQTALSHTPELARSIAEQGLTQGNLVIRESAISWLGRLGDPAAIPALRRALAKEKKPATRAVILSALERLGESIADQLTGEVLLAEARAGLKGAQPEALAWARPEDAPPLRWRDGSPVEADLVRWWFSFALKQKSADGSGMIDRWLSLLDPADAAALGSYVLTTWITRDTILRDPASAHTEALAQINAELDQAREDQRTGRPNYLISQLDHSIEFWLGWLTADLRRMPLHSAAADRGLLALTIAMDGAELATAVQQFGREFGWRTSQTQSLMVAAKANGHQAAIQYLLAASRRFKQASNQAKALELVHQLAEELGWSADELADRTVPTAGLDPDRVLRLDLGGREILGRIGAKGTIELSTAEGTPLRSLPEPRADDDQEVAGQAKKQLAASRKELKAVLAGQTARLYEAMCSQRTWPATEFIEYLVDHPVVSHLVQGLVFTATTPQRLGAGAPPLSFRPTVTGDLIDLADQPFELTPDGLVRLAHASLLEVDQVLAWGGHLARHRITPPFDQWRMQAPPAQLEGTAFDQLEGHLTTSFALRNAATKRGYQRGPTEQAGWYFSYEKAFPTLELTAVQRFTGSPMPERDIACATVSLFFRRGHRQLPLTQVPPVLLAEAWADYAALAELGPYDPDFASKTGREALQ